MVLTDTCLTDEELAAFIDDMVSPEERERVKQHLDSCPSCHEVYAATLQFQEESRPEEVAGPGPLPFVRKRTTRRWLTPALTAAAAAAFAAVLLPLLWSNPAGFATPGLVAALNPVKNTRLAGERSTDPVLRGTGKKPRLGIDSRDFQVGVRLVDLLVNLETPGAPQASAIAKELSEFADDGADLEGKKVWDECCEQLTDKSRPAALERVRQQEKKLREISDEEKALGLRFGEWTEASRLAAVGHLESYFERSDVRAYLKWVRGQLAQAEQQKENQPDMERRNRAVTTLAAIERTIAAGRFTPEDFTNLQEQLAEIIKAYRVPETEFLDDSSEPTEVGPLTSAA